MNLVTFEGCCTAKIITGFGQTGTAEYEYRPETPLTHYQMAKGMAAHMVTQRRRGDATLVVTLNNQQKAGLDVLRGLGWHVSPALHKRAHSETQLHVCYTALHDLSTVEGLAELDKKVAAFA